MPRKKQELWREQSWNITGQNGAAANDVAFHDASVECLPA